MANPNDSAVDAPLDVNGSSERCASPSSEAERLLLTAVHRLIEQLSETNVHLLMLADQTARCLAHVTVLLDLLVADDDESDTDATTYLDGTRIS
jgi:hypothetical protein